MFFAFFGFTQDEMIQPLEVVPKVVSYVGDTKMTYEATRWPDFYDYSSDNPTCGDYLRDTLSLTRKDGFDGKQYRKIMDYTVSLADYGLEDYSGTMKVLITWTVRVEGHKEKVNIWNEDPAKRLCHPWHGTSYQNFPGGDVTTRLYINGSQYGEDFKITIPDAGQSTDVNISDPTQTGSEILTADYFGGEFPEVFTVTVKWYNDTCMDIVSPEDMRNLIITVMPK